MSINPLNQVAELIKAGNKSQARQILLGYLKENRDNEQAWLYMAACAATKPEFEASIQRVLELNPLNGHALSLAKKNKIELPEAAKRIKAPLKPIKKAPKQRSGGRLRRILLLLLIIILAGAAAFVYLGRNEEDAEPAAVEKATEEAIAESTEAPQATEEVQPIETPKPTATPFPSPTPTIPTPTPTPDNSPAGRFVSLNIVSAENQQVRSFYLPDEMLEAVVELLDYDEPITVVLTIEPQNAASSAFSVEQTVAPDDPRELTIPIAPEEDAWTPGIWFVALSIEDRNLKTIPFTVRSLSTPTSEAQTLSVPPSPEPETVIEVSTPTPEPPAVEPTFRLTYNDEAIYLMNISDANQDVSAIRFLQITDANEALDFPVMLWQQGTSRGVGTVYALQPQSCFQLGIRDGAAGTKPNECIRLSAWRVAGVQNLFWVHRSGSPDTFSVLLGDELIAECEIEAGTCEFALTEE